MPAAFPAHVRAAVVAARRRGDRVTDVARELGISSSLVTKWSQEAGIGTQPACKACSHPQRDEIDAALIAGTVSAVDARYPDLTTATLDRHRRVHLGIRVGKGYSAFACPVCDHAEHHAIDLALQVNRSRARLAECYGIAEYVLRHHQVHHLDNPERDAAVAAATESRLAAARKLAERTGPPPGWFFCPECDSPNVRCKGSGDWKEDLGPIHWHVTRCLDCGWPDGQS